MLIWRIKEYAQLEGEEIGSSKMVEVNSEISRNW